MRIIKTVLLALVLGAGCVPPSTPYPGSTPTASTFTPTYGYGTGVYVNGQELTAADKAELEDLVGGAIAPGRYTVDARGNAGPEGQPPVVNLVELARARDQRRAGRGGGSSDIYSTDASGQMSSMTSDGDCTIVSTPDATFATDGC